MFIELTDSNTTIYSRAIESISPHGGHECLARTVSGQVYLLRTSVECAVDAVLRGTPLSVDGHLVRPDEAPKRRGKSAA